MADSLARRWRDAFWQTSQTYETAQRLREAANTERLELWTQELTSVVIETCRAVGWQAAARRNILDLLPISRQEYLALDVMAFAESQSKWRFPVAVIELENSKRDDVVGYSLWKVLCVRAALRIVFCYRRDLDQGTILLRYLSDEVFQAFELQDRAGIEGQTLLVIASRSDAANFPYGFFKWWELSHDTSRFTLFR
jgi:hypothetical protein